MVRFFDGALMTNHDQNLEMNALSFLADTSTTTVDLSKTSHAFKTIPGSHFGHTPVEPRRLDPGMGVAVARRTVFRSTDEECFGKVADRVAAGNMALLGHPLLPHERLERERLRNAIATGALLTSGRHLQHGDDMQPNRVVELFSNCSTAIVTFAKFYLLLNGSGVGRSYDDALIAVDWQKAPNLQVYLPPDHKDYPHSVKAKCKLGVDLGVIPYGTTDDSTGIMTTYIAENLASTIPPESEDVVYHRVGDSREGWAKACEILEAMAFQEDSDKTLFLDFSDVRPRGTPIAGMQDRPASGPLSVMSAFINTRNQVINNPTPIPLWEQALRIDHYFSVEVQVGGARRAARMATKDWQDPGIFEFIRIKSKGGLWTANHSVMVDKEFWSLVQTDVTEDPLSQHAHRVFSEVTECAYINGEPGFINGDQLEDYKTGFAREKPLFEEGEGYSSSAYQTSEGSKLLKVLVEKASKSRFPVTVNPCAEVVLHVTGGYCLISDYAPLLACPVSINDLVPGEIPKDIAYLWDARIEDTVRLGVRFLVRVNKMDAFYRKELLRTNRIGIGPTGLHEYAWLRFGFDFNDLIDPSVSYPFWNQMERLSAIAKEESTRYSKELGLQTPVTVTTIKPAGSSSKLFGLTEGAHLPARRQYLRWVQFKGVRDPITGEWNKDCNPQLPRYEECNYPMRELKTFPGITIVGFPTVPLLIRLNIGYRGVTASEATPEDQYKWLRLLEQYWIGEKQGNQISYTLKVFTNIYDLDAFREIVRKNQPTIRCCAILPSKPDHELGYEYIPEEELSIEEFVVVVKQIKDNEIHEEIDLIHLQCSSGACPI